MCWCRGTLSKPWGRDRLHPSADWVRDFVLDPGAAPGPFGPNGKILVALGR